MIPEFDENGNLPPGVYWAEWDEFEQRFSYNPTRRRLINGLKLAMAYECDDNSATGASITLPLREMKTLFLHYKLCPKNNY